MGGINTLSGLNKIQVDFRPMIEMNMENDMETRRATAIGELKVAFAEIESGAGLTTLVGGHGLQSRVFEFEWDEPSLGISFRLPCGRVLSDEESQKEDDAEIGASALDSAQKKTVLAKIMENEVNVAHVKIALRTVPAFDAGELANAAKAGDGKKLAEQFYRFVSTTKAMVTEEKESEAIQGADEYSKFVGTATDVLILLHPEIAEGARSLDADAREKLFDDAAEASFMKSGEIQRKTATIKDKMEQQRMSYEAKHWSAATSCAMQLQQAVG